MVPGINGKIIAKIKCFEYNKNGHYTDQCPTRQEQTTGEQHVHETINNDDNTVIHEDNNIEVGQKHIQTTEVLQDEDSVIVDDNESLEDLSVNFMFYQEAIIHNINNNDYNYSSTDVLLNSGSSCSVFNNNTILKTHS